VLVVQPQGTGRPQVAWCARTEQLQGPLNPGGVSQGSGRGAFLVRVLEGGQPLHSAAVLCPLQPTLLPAGVAVHRTHPGQQFPDGLLVPDLDAVCATDLTGFGGDPQPPDRTDQGHRRLRARTAHLQDR